MPLLLYGCAAQQPVVVETDVPRGHVVVRPGRSGFVIAAPHGSTDPQTGHFAAELARRTGFGLVVAAGLAIEPDRAYERRVQEAARGPLAYYAEIHGPSRLDSVNRIEIATVGVDDGLAERLRSLYGLIRDAHLRAYPKAPRVDALVEPGDKLFYGATTRRDGVLRLPPRALYLELPRVTRTEARDLYLAILADFLSQAAQLPAGR